MSSVGVFRKVDLDDKSFLEFTSTQTDETLEIRHPSRPSHSLLFKDVYTDDKCCVSCDKPLPFSHYQCTTCKESMDPDCAKKEILLVEENPKSHPHPLIFFSTASLVCHICGLHTNHDPTYICVQCTFVIHKGCIGFPHVIRISRHHHRISFTRSLPPETLSCRVCHKNIDNAYGAYSCGKCDDAYFVHTKCALYRKVWDGKDLDGVPEEDDIIDDGEPFERIADGIILHHFHRHNLQLEIIRAYDAKKVCRGCSLSIYEGQFYSCLEMDCDFMLHESCAHAPRMKRHPSYPHPLKLFVSASDTYRCIVCSRSGTGFCYTHDEQDGSPYYRITGFELCLRCASLTEPFQYQGHNHPLYLPLDPLEKSRCHTCDYKSNQWKLRCFECDYIICIRCATFPYKARYMHDDHFLTIRDGKKASDEVEWCEICEGKIEEVKQYDSHHINQKEELRFYRCDDCCTALHIHCLLGRDMYMKPQLSSDVADSRRLPPDEFRSESAKNKYVMIQKVAWMGRYREWTFVYIHPNSSFTRPFCHGCNQRCGFSIVFKRDDDKIFCSWRCISCDRW